MTGIAGLSYKFTYHRAIGDVHQHVNLRIVVVRIVYGLQHLCSIQADVPSVITGSMLPLHRYGPVLQFEFQYTIIGPVVINYAGAVILVCSAVVRAGIIIFLAATAAQQQ